MTKELAFWVLWIISLLLGGFLEYPFQRRSGVFFLVMAIIGILGWAVFGAIVR